MELQILPIDAPLSLRCPRCGREVNGDASSASEVRPRTFPLIFHVRFTARCPGCGITWRARLKAYNGVAPPAAARTLAVGQSGA